MVLVYFVADLVPLGGCGNIKKTKIAAVCNCGVNSHAMLRHQIMLCTSIKHFWTYYVTTEVLLISLIALYYNILGGKEGPDFSTVVTIF